MRTILLESEWKTTGQALFKSWQLPGRKEWGRQGCAFENGPKKQAGSTVKVEQWNRFNTGEGAGRQQRNRKTGVSGKACLDLDWCERKRQRAEHKLLF